MAEHDAGRAKLLRMANQIATFFRAYPEQEARAGIAQHIADFWTPSMRRDLQTAVDRGDPDLDALVLHALGDGRTHAGE